MATNQRCTVDLGREESEAGYGQLITVALRLPDDLLAYPQAPTYLCTYSIQPVALRALAAGLWGELALCGRLPVRGVEQDTTV